MAYCTKCGQQAQGEAKFCLHCGARIPDVPPPPNSQTSSNEHHTHHGATPQSDAEANKGMAIIAYLLFFVPLLTGDHKKSPFVKHHTNQGTILFIFSAALGIALNIVLSVLRAIFLNLFLWPVFGVLSAILNALWLVPTIFLILGIINAAGGNTKTLPIIGDKFTIIK